MLNFKIIASSAPEIVSHSSYVQCCILLYWCATSGPVLSLWVSSRSLHTFHLSYQALCRCDCPSTTPRSSIGEERNKAANVYRGW